MPDAEYLEYLLEYQTELFGKYFSRFTRSIKDYGGFLGIESQPFLERVSWYSLGDTPGTKVENICPFDWEALKPLPIIPRELKLSVVIAKVKNNVNADDIVFEFEEPKILIGQLFDTNTAYNTVKRSYTAGEEVVLVGGSLDKWRYSSLLLEGIYDQSQIYFTIDDVPYLRLKILKEQLEEISSGGYKWKVELGNNVPQVVNGKYPAEDPDSEEEQQYIYIKNSPEILMDEQDAFIYIGYDLLAGSDIYHRWTTADAQNDILFLKGLPGYIQDPEEPGTDERRLVLKSPYSSTEPIGWMEESVDGRTDEELTDFIINVIEENGGGGGGGGSTFIMKALVNDGDGVKSDDATFNYDGATVLVSDGAVLPTSGSCDNTFNCAFLDNEPILLIRKNNGVWTAIKIQENLIVATPNADVAANATTFAATLTLPLQGTTPTGTITAKGNGFEYMSDEKLAFKHGNDGFWHVIERYETAAIFRTIGIIPAANFNTSSGVLTIGQGNAQKMTCNTANPLQYSVAAGTGNTVLRNMTRSLVQSGKNVQAKKIGRHWFVDVEDCG
jgi:hypothetical protein